ncbi:hypothetical protein O0881_22360 [Janthinobacterium sp. SUN100]|nr:hypothetical protein [Janthinobacterium sp. SUN100]MDN2704733.1 hypothetical protein [Janthinobacterium sp. SUN100]
MALPSGSWTHSFEEDADGVEVYRPTTTFAFPPSRKGRKVLEFGAPAGAMAQGEMTVTSMAPGPDDRPRASPVARLHPLGMGRYALSDAAGTQEVIDIVEATPDVLRLSRR